MIEEDFDGWGGFAVHCDRCSYAEEYNEETFGELIATIKSEGWQIHKTEDGWEHICPNCVATAH